MSISPKPEIARNAIKVYSFLFGLGVLFLLVAYLVASPQIKETLRPRSQIQAGSQTPSAEYDVVMTQNKSTSGFLILFLTGLGVTFSTVAIFEVAKYLVQLLDYRHSTGHEFDEFFGDNASSRSKDGLILLQADNLDHLVSDALSGPSVPVNITSQSRSYKARHWVNRWDMEGAIAIRKKFRELHLDAPRMDPADHNPPADPTAQNKTIKPKRNPNSAKAPFVIAMGLGFTDQTGHAAKDLNKWLRIERTGPCGDCLLLMGDFVPPSMADLQPHDKHNVRQFKVGLHDEDFEREGGFLRILPKAWNFENWKENPSRCTDYALILRRTYPLGDTRKRQIHFVLAGFTERSTAMASMYLAQQWHQLWEDYVRGKNTSEEGYGDFLAVIHGPSDPEKAHEWKVGIQITPQTVGSSYGGWPHPTEMDEPVILKHS